MSYRHIFPLHKGIAAPFFFSRAALLIRTMFAMSQTYYDTMIVILDNSLACDGLEFPYYHATHAGAAAESYAVYVRTYIAPEALLHKSENQAAL